MELWDPVLSINISADVTLHGQAREDVYESEWGSSVKGLLMGFWRKKGSQSQLCRGDGFGNHDRRRYRAKVRHNRGLIAFLPFGFRRCDITLSLGKS